MRSLAALRALDEPRLAALDAAIAGFSGGGEGGEEGEGEGEGEGRRGGTGALLREVHGLRGAWAEYGARAGALGAGLAARVVAGLPEDALGAIAARAAVVEFWTEWFSRLVAACERAAARAQPPGAAGAGATGGAAAGAGGLAQRLSRLPEAVAARAQAGAARLPERDGAGRMAVAVREALAAEAALAAGAAGAAAQLSFAAGRRAAYAAEVAAGGCVVLALSAPDLPPSSGTVVRVGGHRAVLEEQVAEGAGALRALRGFAARFESGERRVVAPEELESTPGVRLWRLLPVREAKAVRDVAEHRGSEAEDDRTRILAVCPRPASAPAPAPAARSRALLLPARGVVRRARGFGRSFAWACG